MALFSRKLWYVSALLVLVCTTNVVRADNNADGFDDGVTIETIEEEAYHPPQIDPGKVHLVENFDDIEAFNKKWIKSEAKKKGVDENLAKYDGIWEIQEPNRRIFKNDLGLVLTTEAKHAAISTLLDKPFEFTDKPLVVQYEVTMQEGQNCGGAYLKLLSRGTNTVADLRQFHDQTPYTIMFGPDKCGNDNKLHFIFRHTNPKNGSIEEKHSRKPATRLDEIYKDKELHLYTLIVRPDNTFSILIDNKEVNAGSLLEDFTPPVNPPEEIDDPNDKKPEDWDERDKIVDPTATKPEDWDENAPAQIIDPNAVKPDGWLEDEPEMIPDPAATKPEDWDEEMDGEWEAPYIDNPACAAAPGCGRWKPPAVPNPDYKGIWHAPLIPNPNYMGRWAPRRIPNPDYFKDDHPFKMTPIHAVGFELWSMSPALLFDNLIITDDVAVAEEWAQKTFALKKAKLSLDSQSWWWRVQLATKHRAGWWALYALYVALPVLAYVAALRRRLREDSVLDRGMKYFAENPWLPVVLIIVSVIFVGLIVYVCCGSKSEPDEDPKKTDAIVEDDPHQSEGEEEASEQERPSKSQLEGPAGDEPGSSSAESAEAAGEADGAGDAQRRRKPRRD